MRSLAPVLLALVVAGCGSSSSSRPPDRSPDLQRKYDEAIARGEVKLGMTRGEVEKAWGKPGKKDTVRRGRRRFERWLYAFSDIYFDEDGYVVSFAGPR